MKDAKTSKVGCVRLIEAHAEVHETQDAKPQGSKLNLKAQFTRPLRYGVVVNIAVSHTAAGGSIPPIGITFCPFIF